MAYRATDFTESRKAQTRDRLLKEARLLVATEGFRGLSIAAAAQRSAIATGTVYRYFPSKSELCIAVFEQATEHEIAAVSHASRQSTDPLSQLRMALECFIQRALQSPRLAYALIAEPVDPELEQARLTYRGHWAQLFAQLIQCGIEQGVFVAQPARLSATALVGAMAESVILPLQHSWLQQQTDGATKAQHPIPQTHCQQIVAFCLRAVVKAEYAP